VLAWFSSVPFHETFRYWIKIPYEPPQPIAQERRNGTLMLMIDKDFLIGGSHGGRHIPAHYETT
jgi:hypothetical protein